MWALAGVDAPAGARSPSPEPRLLVLLAGGLGWGDLGSPPGSVLDPFRDRAVVALVTVGAGHPGDPWSRTLSLGAGETVVFPRERAAALPPAATPEAILEEGVTAREIWSSLTGRPVPDQAGLVLFIPRAEEKTLALGDQLRQGGYSLVLVGGGSGPDEAPTAAALLAGSDRLVLGAVLAEPLQEDHSWPGLLRTDWERLDALVAGAADADLLVVEWGDLTRLQEWERLVPPGRYQQLRQDAVQEAVAWLSGISGPVAQGRDLLFLSITPPRSYPARAPAPLVWISEGPAGLAVSGSTRRPGLLDPGDVAPTILTLLGAPGLWKGMGRPMTVVPAAAPYDTLDRFYRTALGVSQFRRPVLHTYIIVFGSLVLAATLLFALAPGLQPAHTIHQALAYGILTATAAPLAMLAPPFFTDDGRLHLVLMVLFSGLVAWLLWSRVASPWRYPVLAGITFAALVADIATGATLQLHAFLGNDPLGGARYYGVGNEYMGVLLGSGLVTAGALWEWRRSFYGRLLGVAVLALLVVTLAHPRLGANVGGAIAGLFGTAYLMLRLRRRQPRWSDLALIGAGTLVVLALIGLTEALAVPPAARSHLGQMVARILEEGWAPLAETAARKLATNLKLIEYTIWSRVLIATLVAFAILLYRPVGLFRRLMERQPFLGRGIEAALVAALTALAANDSGVLAAATAMIPIMSTLLAALAETRASV